MPGRAHDGLRRSPPRPALGRRAGISRHERLRAAPATLREPHAAETLILELHRLQTDGQADWLAWVLMPNHFHALLSLTGDGSLSQVMQSLKGRSSRALGGGVWQPGFHDHALRAEEDRSAVARYVVANPVRAGLVNSLRSWPYWYCRRFQPGDDPDELLQED